MKGIMASLTLLGLTFWVGFPPDILSKDDQWKQVDEGLFFREFAGPERLKMNDSKISVLKIDPKFYSFKLLCASEHGRVKMTAKKWCEKFKLMGAVNAGMYQKDGITNVGYMKNFNHLNNPKLNNAYKAVLAFNPVESTIPEIQIIDLKCQDFQSLRTKYETLVQNIRMIDCQQANVWIKQDKTFAMSVFGMDQSGNALLIFTESPYSGHDFINRLLSLRISIYNAMYLEGGPEANLYVSANGFQLERVGRHGADEVSLSFAMARPVPNVIGFVKKSK